MSVANPTRAVMLAGVLIALSVVVVEGLLVSDEERLEQHVDALRDSFSAGDQAAVKALLADEFSYDGPRPMGEGDRDESLRRLDDFWLHASEPALNWRPKEVVVEGAVGRVEVSGNVRFRYADSLIIYRVDAVMVWSRAGEGWLLRRLDVPLLRPGVF